MNLYEFFKYVKQLSTIPLYSIYSIIANFIIKTNKKKIKINKTKINKLLHLEVQDVHFDFIHHVFFKYMP